MTPGKVNIHGSRETIQTKDDDPKDERQRNPSVFISRISKNTPMEIQYAEYAHYNPSGNTLKHRNQGNVPSKTRVTIKRISMIA